LGVRQGELLSQLTQFYTLLICIYFCTISLPEDDHLFIYFILFPYIPFRYIPWKLKMSHSVYIIRQLAHGITGIAKVEKYLTTVITFLS